MIDFSSFIWLIFFFFLRIRHPPKPTLFPYPPLSRPPARPHPGGPSGRSLFARRNTGPAVGRPFTPLSRAPAPRRRPRRAGLLKGQQPPRGHSRPRDRKSTRLNSSHSQISYAVFCLKK